jgi:hypothetical protein
VSTSAFEHAEQLRPGWSRVHRGGLRSFDGRFDSWHTCVDAGVALPPQFPTTGPPSRKDEIAQMRVRHPRRPGTGNQIENTHGEARTSSRAGQSFVL